MIAQRRHIYCIAGVVNLKMSESCAVFKANNHVTIDTSICLFWNFNEPVSRWNCVESCKKNSNVSLFFAYCD